MRLYFDTAYVAKCYLNEVDGAKVRELARGAEGLYSSSLCVAELACVFHRQVREGSLTRKQLSMLRGYFLQDVRDEVWALVPITSRLLQQVELLVASLPPACHVRAGDAIHLTSARDAGFAEIWTNDRRLLAAAAHAGLRGRTVD